MTRNGTFYNTRMRIEANSAAIGRTWSSDSDKKESVRWRNVREKIKDGEDGKCVMRGINGVLILSLKCQ